MKKIQKVLDLFFPLALFLAILSINANLKSVKALETITANIYPNILVGSTYPRINSFLFSR